MIMVIIYQLLFYLKIVFLVFHMLTLKLVSNDKKTRQKNNNKKNMCPLLSPPPSPIISQYIPFYEVSQNIKRQQKTQQIYRHFKILLAFSGETIFVVFITWHMLFFLLVFFLRFCPKYY